MMYIRLLLLVLVSIGSISARDCDGSCGQDEGDCDRDSDCLDGLICDFDWWWGDDYCKAGPNTVNYDWANWGDWSECSLSCGGEGTKTRTRDCIAPSNGGYECPSSSQTDTATCEEGPCPVDGGWGAFGDWGECPVSCGGGEHSRTRSCDSPVPDHGGSDCIADGSSDTETESCNTNECPIDGGWGEFGDWEECPVTCGGGDHSRTRVCDNPAAQYGGKECTDDGSSDTESERCNEDPCPIDGGFSAWDDWSECTVTCGGGDQTTARRCDSPEPQFGGKDCEGEFTDCQRCNLDECPSLCPA